MVHEIILITAFLAGIVTFFSPCSIALLPAYVSYYLGRSEGVSEQEKAGDVGTTRLVLSILLALLGGILLTFGFVRPYVGLLGGPPSHDAADFAAIGVGTMLFIVFAHRAEKQIDLRPREDAEALRSSIRSGIIFGLTTVTGFFTFIFSVGAIVILGAASLASYLPSVTLLVAVFIVVLGILMLADVNLSVTLKFIAPRPRSLVSFYTFGIGYAIISSGCLLPVLGALLANVVAAMSAGDVPLALGDLAAYGAGMASLMVIFSVHIAVAKQTTLRYLRKVVPLIRKVGGAIVVASGAFVIWYDWTFLLS